jgi:hypothetical protein
MIYLQGQLKNKIIHVFLLRIMFKDVVVTSRGIIEEKKIIFPLLLYVFKAGHYSHNLELIAVAKNIFRANPPINPDVLVKAFQLDMNVIESLEKKFA